MRKDDDTETIPDDEPLEKLLDLLAIAPKLFAKVGRNLSQEQLKRKLMADEWSASDLLAHLRANADVWGKSIRDMLLKDHPTLRYVSPRGWMTKSGYCELPYEISLKAYEKQRDELISSLRSLKANEWNRGATFTGTTRGKEQTIKDYVRRIVEHEQVHCQQLEEWVQAMTKK